MESSPSMPIKALFLDVGGVLLTNGWDRQARTLAAKTFDLDLEEVDDLHHLNFDTYEEGKLSLEQYITRVVFHRKRPFTPDRFRKFMLAQSKPFPEMIELVRALKARHQLKILVVNNEGRELNAHRIRKFKLDGFVDGFISSCFVHLRKPDQDIFRVALDIGQVPASHVAYVDDRLLFVEVARTLGMHGIHHTDFKSTCAKLASLGLT
jgi:putative hydrolase of the HAD superfamily